MTYQAIVTKFHGPTNTKGSRITARASAGKVTVHWDYGMGQSENHARAAKALAEKFGWGGHWVSGGMPEGNGDVFVCFSNQSPDPNDLKPRSRILEVSAAFSTVQREG